MYRTPKTHVKYTRGPLTVDLTLFYDRWTDPGDYPSGAGSGPLPSGPWYVDDMDGEVILRLDNDDRWSMIDYDSVSQWVNENAYVEIDGGETIVTEWTVSPRSTAEQLVLLPYKWSSEAN